MSNYIYGPFPSHVNENIIIRSMGTRERPVLYRKVLHCTKVSNLYVKWPQVACEFVSLNCPVFDIFEPFCLHM
jgi:hypothetical protein